MSDSKRSKFPPQQIEIFLATFQILPFSGGNHNFFRYLKHPIIPYITSRKDYATNISCCDIKKRHPMHCKKIKIKKSSMELDT